MSNKQYKKLSCSDVNPIGGCDYEAIGSNDEVVMHMMADHEMAVHKMIDVPPGMVAKMKAAITTVVLKDEMLDIS
jgi:predicted small metal-binding protein